VWKRGSDESSSVEAIHFWSFHQAQTTFSLALVCAAISTQPDSMKNYSTYFVGNCLSTTDPHSCDKCIVDAPADDCTRTEELEFYALCSGAPFDTASEIAVPSLPLRKSTRRASLASHPKLEAANCTSNNFAEFYAFCTRVN
jgi:hypothetical protein